MDSRLNWNSAAIHHLSKRLHKPDPLNATTTNGVNYEENHLKLANGQLERGGSQTFLGLRQGDVLCHVAERRLLNVPESHLSVGEGRPQQKSDCKQTGTPLKSNRRKIA